MKEDVKCFIRGESTLPFFLHMAGVSGYDGGYHIRRSYPNLCLLEYISSGCGTVVTENGIIRAAKDDIYIAHSNAGQFFFSDNIYPCTKIWFIASGSLIGYLFDTVNLSHVNYIQSSGARQHFQQIIDIAFTQEITQEELMNKAAIVFHSLTQAMSARVRQSNAEEASNAQKVKDYIDSNITGNISVDMMAAQVFLSQSQTIRIFKSTYGVTPYDYILRKKIEIAKMMLKFTGISIKEIAEQIGFSDEHYFSRQFKLKTGQQPRTFRKDFMS